MFKNGELVFNKNVGVPGRFISTIYNDKCIIDCKEWIEFSDGYLSDDLVLVDEGIKNARYLRVYEMKDIKKLNINIVTEFFSTKINNILRKKEKNNNSSIEIKTLKNNLFTSNVDYNIKFLENERNLIECYLNNCISE